MIYILWRVIFILLLISLCLVCFKKKLSKKNLIIVLSTMIILCASLCFFPIENLFMSFDTPESAFNYYRTGEIKGVVYGDNSSLVYYKTSSETYSYVFMKRTGKGYKLPEPYCNEIIADRFDSKGKFEVYKVDKTQDYYVIGYTVVLEDSTITDSNNQLISNVVYSDTTYPQNAIFYSYIGDYSNKYYLLINSEKIYIKRQSEKKRSRNTMGRFCCVDKFR